jgi:hypothetical protein
MGKEGRQPDEERWLIGPSAPLEGFLPCNRSRTSEVLYLRRLDAYSS